MDRRQDSDDRRKIERFTNPPVRSHFKQMHRIAIFLTVLSFSTGVYQLARGFYFGDSEVMAMGIFKSIMAFVLTTYLFRYSKALKGYLDNESLGNLDRSMETQAALFFVFSFLATISSIIYVVFA